MESDSSTSEAARPLNWLIAPLRGGLRPLQRLLRRRQSHHILAGEPLAQERLNHGDLSMDSLERAVGEREAKMIRAILKMEDTTAREIMVPRVDMLAVEVGTPVSDLAQLMVEGGHSRIPLYRETIDNIRGIVHARDVVRLLSRQEQVSDLRAVARSGHFVPESIRLEDLLREFQERHITIAIVVDEYGGVAGLVTMEDLLEEIVGEIEDEFETGEPEVVAVSEHEAIMDARVSIDRVNEFFSVALEGDGFDTLGGLVYKQLGKMGTPGDHVEYGGVSMEVLSTIGRRIRKVRVTKAQDDTEKPDKLTQS